MMRFLPLLFTALAGASAVPKWDFGNPIAAQSDVYSAPVESFANITALNITLPVDHNGSTTDTFENRYWVDDRFWRPGGPIMLFDVGEAAADDTVAALGLTHQPAHARANNALIIVWEHRYYGQSWPSRLPETYSPDDVAAYFRFLTVEQALEDVAVFARTFKWKDAATSPGQVPWVFVGGSYPGARAAWARKRNPDIWYASLASSAVVEAATQNPWYYEVQLQALRENGYRPCADDMVAMAKYIDAANNTQIIDWVYMVRNTSDAVAGAAGGALDSLGTAENAHELLGEMVTTVLVGALLEYQSVAFQTTPYSRGDLGYFCGLMGEASGNSTRGVFGTMAEESAVAVFAEAAGKNLDRILRLNNGQISKRDLLGPPHIADRQILHRRGAAESGQQLSARQQQQQQGETFDPCAADAETCRPWLQTMTNSWTYQVCTDFANLLTVPPTGDSLYPRKFNSYEYMRQWWCVDSFNITATPGRDLNRKYGGWSMASSNTLFVDGEFDPWRAGTVNSQIPEAKGRPRTEVVPAAGQVMTDTVFGMVVEGGAHCPDLGIGWNLSGRPAFELWNKALATWLPKFENHTVSNTTAGTGPGVSSGSSRAASGAGNEEQNGVAGRTAGVVFAAVMAVAAIVVV